MTDLENLLAEVTPGEWRAEYDVRTWGWADVVADGFRIGWPTKATDLTDEDCTQRKANASLIAMAPDLARKVIAAEKIVAAYKDLLATVEGECQSLVDEDRGVSDVFINLVIEGNEALSAWEAAQ